MKKPFSICFLLTVLFSFQGFAQPDLSGTNNVDAQVPSGAPVEESSTLGISPDLPLDQAFPVGVLSDPEELALIDGLDDPLERVRLRDFDANMVLDLIQSITKRLHSQTSKSPSGQN